MGFQVSPGVQVKEINGTNVIPAVSSSIGAFVGGFNWGPVETITTIGSENELAAVFATPSEADSKYFLTAASFLQYGNNLSTVRAVDDATALNAATTAAMLIYSKDHVTKGYDVIAPATIAAAGKWVARYPGTMGNAITVSVCLANFGATDSFTGWADKSLFDSAPTTSTYAEGLKTATFGDELHIVVKDSTGAVTGTPGTILETFAYLSLAKDAKKTDGTSIYYKTVINTQSEYIYWGTDDALTVGAADATVSLDASMNILGSAATVIQSTAALATTADVDPTNGVVDYTFTGGVDGLPAQADLITGYDLFGDSETVDISLMFSYPLETGTTDKTLAAALLAIADDRKDCVAFVSPPVACSNTSTGGPATVIAWANLLASTSYGFTDSTAAYVYDKYNDTYVWIGMSGHMAGLCAATDAEYDPWFSPGGMTRGQIFGVTKLAYNPKKADRDNLYKARVNPIVAFPGQGTVLYGDRTLDAKPNAFDRINVRRLFIVLEKAISTAAKFQLFEFNDEFTRAMFKNMTEPFLRDVQGRRGLTDFLVVCDETNNTGQVIDANRFVGDIYIKPARSINFITLNFIATRTGVDFSEIAG